MPRITPQVQKFILDYIAARCEMVESGLISNQDPKAVAREVEEFKIKIAGTDLLQYWLELPTFPCGMDGDTEEEARNTILGRCRQWARARQASNWKGSGKQQGADVFLKAAGSA